MHLYSMSLENVKMVLLTMALSFEDVQLWMSDVGNILLIGSGSKIAVNQVQINRIMNHSDRTKRDFSTYLLAEDPPEFYGRLLLDKPGILEFTRGALINSDDSPYLEFMAPKDLYTDNLKSIFQKLSEWSEKRRPEALKNIEGDNNHALVYYHRSKMASRMGDLMMGEYFIEKAINLDATREDFYFQKAQVLLQEKKYKESEETALNGFKINKTPAGIQVLADVLRFTGRTDAALELLKQNKDLMKDHALLYGRMLFGRGQYSEAIPYLEEALEKKQDTEYLLLEKIGKCYEALGRADIAERYYIESIKKEEMNPRSQFNLGELYWVQQRYEEARDIFLFLTQYWPDKSIYALRLADCYKKLNQPDKVRNILKKIPPNSL